MPSSHRSAMVQGVVLGLLVALIAGLVWAQVGMNNYFEGTGAVPVGQDNLPAQAQLQTVTYGNLGQQGQQQSQQQPAGITAPATCPPAEVKVTPCPLCGAPTFKHVILKGASSSVQQCEKNTKFHDCNMCITTGSEVYNAVVNIPGPPALARLPASPELTFLMATLAPGADEVARVLHATRTVGYDQRMLMEKLFQETDGDCIDRETGKPRLVVDLGANHGYYGLTAAMRGCEVVMVEPQPHLVAMIRSTIALNGLEDRARVIHAGVGGDQRTTATMPINNAHSGVRSLHKGGAPEGAPPGSYITVDVLPLKDILACAIEPGTDKSRHKEIFLMKIDVEGFEGTVLESKTAQTLFSSGQVRNLHLEMKNLKIVSTLLDYNKSMYWGLYCETYEDSARITRANLIKPAPVTMHMTSKVPPRTLPCEDIWISKDKHGVLFENKIWHRKKFRGIPPAS